MEVGNRAKFDSRRLILSTRFKSDSLINDIEGSR